MGAVELPGRARLELAQGVVPLNPQEAVFEGLLAGWARQRGFPPAAREVSLFGWRAGGGLLRRRTRRRPARLCPR